MMILFTQVSGHTLLFLAKGAALPYFTIWIDGSVPIRIGGSGIVEATFFFSAIPVYSKFFKKGGHFSLVTQFFLLPHTLRQKQSSLPLARKGCATPKVPCSLPPLTSRIYSSLSSD